MPAKNPDGTPNTEGNLPDSMNNIMKCLTNPLAGIAQTCGTFVLLVLMGSSFATTEQSGSIAVEQAPSALGSTKFPQEYKIDDDFLVRNNHHFFACTKRATGVTSEMLTCLSASVERLDAYLSGLMIRKKSDENSSELFFKNRKSSCLKIADDLDGSIQEVVYADCLRIRTIEEIIKKSHSVEDIDQFLLLIMRAQKISLIEREKFFNNRNTFCINATKFRSEFLEKNSLDEDFYKHCLSTRTINEIFKKLN